MIVPLHRAPSPADSVVPSQGSARGLAPGRACPRRGGKGGTGCPGLLPLRCPLEWGQDSLVLPAAAVPGVGSATATPGTSITTDAKMTIKER